MPSNLSLGRCSKNLTQEISVFNELQEVVIACCRGQSKTIEGETISEGNITTSYSYQNAKKMTNKYTYNYY